MSVADSSRAVPRVLSLGGGLDSWVALLEAVRRGEPPDVVVFADVGDLERRDPGEWPSTYRHLDEVVRPFCAARGIELVVLDTESGKVIAGTDGASAGRVGTTCNSGAQFHRPCPRSIERVVREAA